MTVETDEALLPNEPAQCKCVQHLKNAMYNETIPLDVRQLFALMFGSEGVLFLADVQAGQGFDGVLFCSQLSVLNTVLLAGMQEGKWKTNEAGKPERQQLYNVPFKAPLSAF